LGSIFDPHYKRKTIMISNATAVWNGSGKEGKGTMSTKSTVLSNAHYSFRTRFEGSEPGTTPEELMAAAHAGCFSMKLSFVLGAAGFTPDTIETSCAVTIDNGAVTLSALTTKAKVPGITAEKFAECAADAKANCPVSKAYNCEITLDASLM